MSLVTLAIPYDQSEALVLRSKLEAHGILVFMPQFNTGFVMPHLSIAIGGYPIQVPRAVYDEALSILKEFTHLKTEIRPASEGAIPGYRCPKCQSPKVAAQGSWWGLFMILQIVVIGIVPKSNRIKCGHCGNGFKAGSMPRKIKYGLLFPWSIIIMYQIIIVNSNDLTIFNSLWDEYITSLKYMIETMFGVDFQVVPKYPAG